MTAEKVVQVARIGGRGGGGGNLGNARKKTFFFPGGVPLVVPLIWFNSDTVLK